jgi:hypothetical protein
MAGAGAGDNLTFTGSMGKDVPVQLRNWYMEGFFAEKLMNRIGLIATCIIFAVSFSLAGTVAMQVFISARQGGAF